MNILVVGKRYPDAFAEHISETFVSMGHVVRSFVPGFESAPISGRIGHRLDQIRRVIHSASDSIPRIRGFRMRALWEEVEKGPLDVVIVCHDYLLPDELVELKRRTGAVLAMWFPDALVNVGKGYFMNAPYDGLFFKDPYIVSQFAGVLPSPVYYLPECFNPFRHFVPEGEALSKEYACDIATAGNSHSWRVAVYKHLGGYNVKLWGGPAPMWMPAGVVSAMHQGKAVINRDKARAFLGAKIVVNNLHYGEIWGINARAFEAAGIGAFQLVDWRPALGQLFEDGKEIISFRGMRDLIEKIEFWIKRPDERRAIATAGKRRAHSEHTYALRLKMLLDSLARRSHGFPMPEIAKL